MNDIYRQQKRTMTSKQFSSPPPPSTQSRRLYENTVRTKHYPPVDIQLNTHSTTRHSPYFQYSTISNQLHTNNNAPYASSTYGVYHRSPPPNLKSSPPLYTSQDKPIDPRNQPHHSQQHQLSRSLRDNYYYPKSEDLDGLIHAIYGDEEEEEENGNNDEENRSEVFSYTDNTGVSL